MNDPLKSGFLGASITAVVALALVCACGAPRNDASQTVKPGSKSLARISADERLHGSSPVVSAKASQGVLVPPDSTPDSEPLASASALPEGAELWIGNTASGRKWKASGDYAFLKFPAGESVQMRIVDGVPVITLDKLQVESVGAGGPDNIVRIEMAKPAEVTP